MPVVLLSLIDEDPRPLPSCREQAGARGTHDEANRIREVGFPETIVHRVNCGA